MECARAEQRLYDLSADYLDERAVEELSAPEDEYGSIAWIKARIAEAEAGEEVEEDEFFSTPLYTSASLQDQLAQAEESLEKAKASLADTYTKTSEVVADVLAACLPVVPNDWGISIVQSVASVIAECEIWAEDTGSDIKCRQKLNDKEKEANDGNVDHYCCGAYCLGTCSAGRDFQPCFGRGEVRAADHLRDENNKRDTKHRAGSNPPSNAVRWLLGGAAWLVGRWALVRGHTCVRSDWRGGKAWMARRWALGHARLLRALLDTLTSSGVAKGLNSVRTTPKLWLQKRI